MASRAGGPHQGQAHGEAREGAGRRRSLRERAIALLARRDYARAELKARLMRGHDSTEVDAVAVETLLDDLAAAGYLSEARYAQALVTRRQATYSRRAIARELEERGVAKEASRSALAALPEDDTVALHALWLRRFGRAPADDREKARQVRFLQSRGFALSEILKLLRDPPLDDASG